MLALERDNGSAGERLDGLPPLDGDDGDVVASELELVVGLLSRCC